jgi:CAAX prenyl protease-like protein
MRNRNATLAYVAPFVAFIAVMAIEKALGLPPAWMYRIRCLVGLAVLLLVSRPLLSFRASRPLQSIALGVAVFAIWVAPDVLFGYRGHWLFENSFTGKAASSLPAGVRVNWEFLFFRVLGSTLLVPILEELFWRGWMMRWLINVEFTKVPMGTYKPAAFWIVAALFASEHGPYWEVGLAAGILYNWWLVRTRNLADCMVAHAVTNGVLSVYVLLTQSWQYWL